MQRHQGNGTIKGRNKQTYGKSGVDRRRKIQELSKLTVWDVEMRWRVWLVFNTLHFLPDAPEVFLYVKAFVNKLLLVEPLALFIIFDNTFSDHA